MAKCPKCGKSAATSSGLAKHLSGLERYGGHGIPEMEAQGIAVSVFAGNYRQAVSSPADKPIIAGVSDAKLLSDPYASFLIRFFQTLVEHKRLPKYQFERRVDAVITTFLPAILKRLYEWDVERVVPEFPLKKASNNQSTNVDHLLFRRAQVGGAPEAWIFFELKTDDASCRDDQVSAYVSAMDKGMPALMEDLETIARASMAGEKYEQLRKRVAAFPVDPPIELVYLAPCRLSAPDRRVHALTFQDLENLRLDEFAQVWDLFRTIVVKNM